MTVWVATLPVFSVGVCVCVCKRERERKRKDLLSHARVAVCTNTSCCCGDEMQTVSSLRLWNSGKWLRASFSVLRCPLLLGADRIRVRPAQVCPRHPRSLPAPHVCSLTGCLDSWPSSRAAKGNSSEPEAAALWPRQGPPSPRILDS